MTDFSSPSSIVISGASAGLGAALARAYAAPGRTLLLIARNTARLGEVAARCRSLGASVETVLADTTDAAAIAAAVDAFDARAPIDLVIANAGIFTGHGPNRRMETTADVAAQVTTNVIGTANLVQPVVDRMRTRKRGHVAIVGSLAALQPLADAPGYSASKAAVMSYGEALQEFLIEEGIRVSLIYPGHIKTAQTDIQVGNMPFMLTPEKAAAKIKSGLDKGRGYIVFPWQLHGLILAGRQLHWRLRTLAGKDFRFHIKRDDLGPK